MEQEQQNIFCIGLIAGISYMDWLRESLFIGTNISITYMYAVKCYDCYFTIHFKYYKIRRNVLHQKLHKYQKPAGCEQSTSDQIAYQRIHGISNSNPAELGSLSTCGEW